MNGLILKEVPFLICDKNYQVNISNWHSLDLPLDNPTLKGDMGVLGVAQISKQGWDLQRN